MANDRPFTYNSFARESYEATHQNCQNKGCLTVYGTLLSLTYSPNMNFATRTIYWYNNDLCM